VSQIFFFVVTRRLYLGRKVECSALSDAPTLLHELFDEAADRWPDRVAVEVPPGRDRPERRAATYVQLRRASDALARRLQPLVSGECVVVILADRTSEQLFVAQLGALKAGAAYTCIDPSFPDQQVRQILADAEPAALLVDEAGRSRLEQAALGGANVLLIEDSSAFASPFAPSALRRDEPGLADPSRLAYIIYTSGTTGRPKGVMVEHRSIVNLVLADRRHFQLSPEDRVGQSSSAAYDSSLEETWLAWAAGAAVVVLDDEASRLGPDLIAWLRRERISVLCPPPTLLRATG